LIFGRPNNPIFPDKCVDCVLCFSKMRSFSVFLLSVFPIINTIPQNATLSIAILRYIAYFNLHVIPHCPDPHPSIRYTLHLQFAGRNQFAQAEPMPGYTVDLRTLCVEYLCQAPHCRAVRKSRFHPALASSACTSCNFRS